MTSQMMASFVLTILIMGVVVTGSKFSNIREVEIDKLLKKINKPAVKSIKSPDGDIIDCVDIYKQPAFDHPLLKNHTIKMRPSSYPEGWNHTASLNTEKHTQLWTINGRCPENTIPIRRTRKEDILQAKSIERFGKKDPNSKFQMKPTNPSTRGGTHAYAAVKVDGTFHGSKATISVWKPFVHKREEFSLSQIWIQAEYQHIPLNSIEVGWQAYPRFYRDSNPRFFIYYTDNDYRTGCYNLACSGFMQTGNQIVPGATDFNPASVYNGEQKEITIVVWKDTQSGDWWLGVDDHIVGYWPNHLLPALSHGARSVLWGGEIVDEKSGGRHTKTQMGSGHFAQEGFRKASYFRNVEVIDEHNNLIGPPTQHQTRVTESNCYNLRLAQNDVNWGSHFFYGGPGRNPHCE